MAKIEHERSAENATGQLHRVLAELDCARQQASRAQEETRTLESLLEGRKRDAADLEARGRVMQAELQKAGEQNALLKVEVKGNLHHCWQTGLTFFASCWERSVNGCGVSNKTPSSDK